MEKELFRKWLEANYATSTVNKHLSNCKRIESQYDDLNSFFPEKANDLIKKFDYGTTESKENKPAKHKINIVEGDVRKTSATLKSSLNLYFKFLEDSSFKEISDKEIIRRIKASIKSRIGQPKFRKDLLDAYNSSCSITGTKVVSTLEAAHILPYAQFGDNYTNVNNGILLRSDVHLLFDLNQIQIDKDYIIKVDPALNGTQYAQFDKKEITLPEYSQYHPNTEYLERKTLLGTIDHSNPSKK